MFLTIKKAAIYTGIPEYVLRKMRKMNELPGFTSGNRFYVNIELLKVKLVENAPSIPGEV